MNNGLPDPASVKIETVKGKGHVYTVDGVEYIGATTFLNSDGSGTFPLLKWAAKLTREGRDYEAEYKESAQVGTEFHGAVASETLHPGTAGELGVGADRSLNHWRGWWANAGLTPIAVEQPIWSKAHGYAGSIDLVASDSDGKIGIVDYKSGETYGIIKHHRQLAAYFMAANDFLPVSWALIVGCPRKAGEKLRVTKMGQITGKKFIHTARLFDSFLACKTIWSVDRGL